MKTAQLKLQQELADVAVDGANELVAGVDEVGRGPLAGPVVAAAVILPDPQVIEGLADSKALTAAARTRCAAEIRFHARSWAIGRAEIDEIDQHNILGASMLAMQRAVAALRMQPNHVFVDGNRCPSLPCAATAIVKGDSLVPAISAASIIAKVYRDRLMELLEIRYPGYGFARHKGYPTGLHLRKLNELGPCACHRRSFGPVAALCARPNPDGRDD